MTEVHCLRIREGDRAWWVFFDKTYTLRGQFNEPKRLALKRWKWAHNKIVTHQGLHSPAEAAAAIADYQMGD